jgi:hypothetical protein
LLKAKKGGITMATTESVSTVVQADWVAGPQQGQWTYEDYAAIPEDGQRYEVVNGVLYMSPAPNLWHQSIVGEMRSSLAASGAQIITVALRRLDLSHPHEPSLLDYIDTSRYTILPNTAG